MSKTSNHLKLAVLRVWLESLKKKTKPVVVKAINLDEEE